MTQYKMNCSGPEFLIKIQDHIGSTFSRKQITGTNCTKNDRHRKLDIMKTQAKILEQPPIPEGVEDSESCGLPFLEHIIVPLGMFHTIHIFQYDRKDKIVEPT